MKDIKLYDYQEECVEIINKNTKGIICLPTGTGKTIIQAALIAQDIITNQKFSIYVINAPRIILSYQLLKEVYSFLHSKGIEARYMSVHSGGSNDLEDLEKIRLDANLNEGVNIPYSDIKNSTSSIEISEFIQTAKKQNLSVVFFSTYNSAERIEKGRKREIINIVVNDEAHYLVQERFHDILKELKSEKCFFFTATTIHSTSDKGRGMNNEDSYGKIIYQMTPREAIDRGKMVRPRMHFVITKNEMNYNQEDFNSSIGSIIEESFKQHAYTLNNVSPKILISVKGAADIKTFFDSKEYKKMIRLGIMIYAVHSDESIGNNINGVQYSRVEFLKRMKEDGKNRDKRMIVLHFDILSEGLDISGFSGILPLRTLTKSKFLQTYGRAARLHPDDRNLLETGEINPNDLDEFLKPFAWVIVPTVIHENADSSEHIKNLIEELRDYGFNPKEDIVVTDNVNGLPTIDKLEALNKIKKNCKKIGESIEKLEAHYEDLRIASLSDFDFMMECIK